MVPMSNGSELETSGKSYNTGYNADIEEIRDSEYPMLKGEYTLLSPSRDES